VRRRHARSGDARPGRRATDARPRVTMNGGSPEKA
jgi:hypothetical protein